MKPELQQLDVMNKVRSIHFFKLEETIFRPFWHYHPEIELTLILKGEGTRFVGDSISRFTNFDLVLLGENLPHHWVSITDGNVKDHEAYVFIFEKNVFECFPECRSFKIFFEKAKQGLHFYAPKNELVKKIIDFEYLSPVTRLGLLMEIIQDLVSDNQVRTLASKAYLKRFYSESSKTKIAKTTNYILEHLNESLTVNQMAEYTNMVPQSFCRWFKKHSGHSFISYLNQTRIERVCHLLRSTALPIQNIAFSCGFESISHFNRTFKQFKNCSPKIYRMDTTII